MHGDSLKKLKILGRGGKSLPSPQKTSFVVTIKHEDSFHKWIYCGKGKFTNLRKKIQPHL
jgi:hypothetical protein